MAARMTITCTQCGASITDDVAYAMEWDLRHEAVCPKSTKEATR